MVFISRCTIVLVFVFLLTLSAIQCDVSANGFDYSKSDKCLHVQRCSIKPECESNYHYNKNRNMSMETLGNGRYVSSRSLTLLLPTTKHICANNYSELLNSSAGLTNSMQNGNQSYIQPIERVVKSEQRKFAGEKQQQQQQQQKKKRKKMKKNKSNGDKYFGLKLLLFGLLLMVITTLV